MATTNIRGSQIADGANGVDLTVDVTGTLPVGNGGTGATSLAGAGILTSGGALGTPASGNASNLTSFPTLNQNTTGTASNVTGTVAIANGGTGQTSLTSLSLTTPTLTGATVTDYVESVVAIGNTSTAKTIALTSGTVQTATLTGNCTFTMPTATAGKSFVLLLKTGAGSFTATFTGVKWPTAGAPTITTAASKMDLLTFVADGSVWYGSYVQGYTP